MIRLWGHQIASEDSFDPQRNAQNCDTTQPKEKRNKPFVCPNVGCNSMYNRKNNLTYHMRNTCGLRRRFKCGFCNYMCKVKSDIRRHSLKKHVGREVYVLDLYKQIL